MSAEAAEDLLVEQEEAVAVEKPKPEIVIAELSNLSYISENPEFLALVKEFADKIDIPTIRYESLHNYLCTVVQGIWHQRYILGLPEKQITYKCFVGMIDGNLAGFTLFYLLPNRQPHIQTIDWPYCHTRNPDKPGKGDIRIAYRFALEVLKWKKIWNARYISLIAADETLNRVAKRLFKKPKACGTYWVAEGIRSDLLKS